MAKKMNEMIEKVKDVYDYVRDDSIWSNAVDRTLLDEFFTTFYQAKEKYESYLEVIEGALDSVSNNSKRSDYGTDKLLDLDKAARTDVEDVLDVLFNFQSQNAEDSTVALHLLSANFLKANRFIDNDSDNDEYKEIENLQMNLSGLAKYTHIIGDGLDDLIDVVNSESRSIMKNVLEILEEIDTPSQRDIILKLVSMASGYQVAMNIIAKISKYGSRLSNLSTEDVEEVNSEIELEGSTASDKVEEDITMASMRKTTSEISRVFDKYFRDFDEDSFYDMIEDDKNAIPYSDIKVVRNLLVDGELPVSVARDSAIAFTDAMAIAQCFEEGLSTESADYYLAAAFMVAIANPNDKLDKVLRLTEDLLGIDADYKLEDVDMTSATIYALNIDRGELVHFAQMALDDNMTSAEESAFKRVFGGTNPVISYSVIEKYLDKQGKSKLVSKDVQNILSNKVPNLDLEIKEKIADLVVDAVSAMDI